MNQKPVIGIIVLLAGGIFAQPNKNENVGNNEMTENPVTDYLESLDKLCSGDNETEIEDIKDETAENKLIKAMCKKSSTRQGLVSCPVHFVAVNGDCYHFSVSGANWHLARLTCNSMGADLADFEDYDEYDEVQKTLRYYFSLRANWWTGASELAEPNLWTWTSIAKYVPAGMWCPGEPPARSDTDTAGECMIMTTSDCGKAAPCTDSNFRNKPIHYICKMRNDCEKQTTVFLGA